MDMNRILVPVSFAPSCKKAIRTAASLAAAFDAKLFVVNVYKTPPQLFHSVGGLFFGKEMEAERKDRIKKLDELVRREMKILKLSLDVQEINVEDEDPVKAIIRLAKEEHVDLMVLSHHEETKLEHYLFGRNIGKLVEGAPCDVIVTRTQLFQKIGEARKAA